MDVNQKSASSALIDCIVERDPGEDLNRLLGKLILILTDCTISLSMRDQFDFVHILRRLNLAW